VTGSPGGTQTYHELAAIARAATSLVDQIAPDSLEAHVAASTIVAAVLSEFGLTASAVSGHFGTEPHAWLEAEGYRIDLARKFLDAGPLVEPASASSWYRVETSFPACWLPEEAVAAFADVFDYPTISAARGWTIFEYLVGTSFVSDRVA
jgi:hypothetical protein